GGPQAGLLRPVRSRAAVDRRRSGRDRRAAPGLDPLPRGKLNRRGADVGVGERLPTRPIGPHTKSSFATEWRAFTFTVWGASRHEGPEHIEEAGWLDEMSRDMKAAEDDPSLADGLYRGPSRGHTDDEHAQLIGMPRAY